MMRSAPSRAAQIVALAVVVLLIGAAPLGAQEESAPRSHTVKRGDTLWDLARFYLGDSYLWPEIYRLNTDIIDDPHWIYPGEVLRLPSRGAAPMVADRPKAEEPPDSAPPAATPTSPTPPGSAGGDFPPGELDGPTIFPKPRTDIATARQRVRAETPFPAVSVNKFVAAPFVDRSGGPRGAGAIIKVVNLSVTVSGRDPKARVQPSDDILIRPPAGSAAAEGERYVSYTVGPYIEDVGQLIVPTGIVKVTRAPRSGEAAVATVTHVFGEIQSDQRLMPYDSTSLQITGRPQAVPPSGWSKVKLIVGDEVLPSLQDYLVIDVSSRDGIKLGDEFMLFEARHHSDDRLSDPEIPIAFGRAIRVTAYATTLMITGQRHPKIQTGTLARRIAAMP